MMHLIQKILWALKMAPKDKDLQEIYNRVFADALDYMQQVSLVKWWQQRILPLPCVYTKPRWLMTSIKEMVKTIMESEVEPYT